jgi:hypothetical protein
MKEKDFKSLNFDLLPKKFTVLLNTVKTINFRTFPKNVTVKPAMSWVFPRKSPDKAGRGGGGGVIGTNTTVPRRNNLPLHHRIKISSQKNKDVRQLINQARK